MSAIHTVTRPAGQSITPSHDHGGHGSRPAASSSIWASQALKTLYCLLGGVAIMLALPAGNGLTEYGVRFIAILIASMAMWIVVGTDWTALLFLGLLVIGGILTPGQVWAGSLGNPIVMLVLVYTMIAVCLANNGVIDAVTAWFISRKFVEGRPYVFITMFFAANFALAIIMHSFASFVVFLTMTIRLCKRLGIAKSHPLYILLMLGNLWVTGIAAGASPIAKTLPNIIIGLVYEQLGIQITYLQWLAVGLPFMALTLATTVLTIRLFKPDVSSLRDLDVPAFVAETPKMTKAGWIAIITTSVVIAMTLLPELFLSFGWLTGISGWFMGLGIAVPAIVGIAFLSVTKVKGKPVLEPGPTFKEVPLSMLVFVGAIMVMGGPLSSDHTGVIPWLANLLDPVFGGMNPFLIVVFAVAGSIALTNFISNTVAGILFFNLGVAIFFGAGLMDNTAMIIAFGIAISLASSLAVLTPSATIVTPMLFDAQHVTMANSIKYNMVWIALTFIVVAAFVPLAQVIVPALGL